MKFDMKRPCAKCPFRNDITPYLRVDRIEEIIDAITRLQQTFACHETTVPSDSDDDDDDGEMIVTKDNQHCAGALIFLEHMEAPNQMMRICERLGEYDRTALHMDSPVYDDLDTMIEAYEDAGS